MTGINFCQRRKFRVPRRPVVSQILLADDQFGDAAKHPVGTTGGDENAR